MPFDLSSKKHPKVVVTVEKERTILVGETMHTIVPGFYCSNIINDDVYVNPIFDARHDEYDTAVAACKVHNTFHGMTDDEAVNLHIKYFGTKL